MRRIILLLILIPSWSNAQLLYERYPWHLPNWLWKDRIRAIYMDSTHRKELVQKTLALAYLKKNTSYTPYLGTFETEVSRELSSKFALVDLTRDALVYSRRGIYLAVRTDSLFDTPSCRTLNDAVKLFVSIALDDDVISEAFKNSTTKPTPFPQMYEKMYSADSIPAYAPTYLLYQQCRSKPRRVSDLKQQLQQAMSTSRGDPALLLISAYDGDVWYGYSYFNYYYMPNQQLSRLSPQSGYLYIALNRDSLRVRQDPQFWASKLAHEILHNLGYWHPKYKNLVERDTNNMGTNQAFIVAYERAILRKLESQMHNNASR